MDSEDLLTTYEIMGKLTPFTGHGMMILQGGNKLYLKQLVISRAEKNRALHIFHWAKVFGSCPRRHQTFLAFAWGGSTPISSRCVLCLCMRKSVYRAMRRYAAISNPTSVWLRKAHKVTSAFQAGKSIIKNLASLCVLFGMVKSNPFKGSVTSNQGIKGSLWITWNILIPC